MLQNLLLSVAVVNLAILLGYSIYFFSKLSFLKSKEIVFDSPISIIICAKNEAENLKQVLPVVLSQDYKNYEVVVVNDQSNDATAFVLKEFEKKYTNLKVVTIEQHINHRPGKKFALTLGIKTAKHEHLLLTDADCMPSSKDWAKQMCRNFNNSDIILGYGAYKKTKGLLNKIIRFDTFNVAQQYLSYSLAGQTYMGVGRNIAYKKSLFFNNKGFAKHIHIPSGDDDLFIQEIAPNNSVAIEVNEQAHTISEVIEKWGEWIYQKRRHITTAPLYKLKFKILLAVYPYAQLLFWVALGLLFYIKAPLEITLALLGVKLCVTYLVNYKAMKSLKVLDLYWLHPLYEITHLIIQGFFVLLNSFNKPKKWSR